MKNVILTAIFSTGLATGMGTTTIAQAASDTPLSCWNQLGSEANLKTFDDLDFNVFTNQKWDELKKSHAEDIIVNWPDGRVTTGIDVHIEDLKSLFVFAPDTRILEHPIRISCGDLTAVTGVFEGTFSEPMPIGDGNFIAPTGKAFRIDMATIGKWENGKMNEEWLFWDNQTYMNQIGLGQ